MANNNTRYYSPPTAAPQEPPTAENGKWLYLSPVWHAHVMSLITMLQNRKLWAGTEEEIDETVSSVQYILASSEENHMEDMRTDSRGNLEKKVNGEWQYVDNSTPVRSDCGCDGGNITNYNIPETTTDDKLCNAAWHLTNIMIDDIHDAVYIYKIGFNIMSGVFKILYKQPVPIVPQLVELVTDTVPNSAIDWFLDQLSDDDTREAVAKLIFCALKEAYPDQLDDTLNFIDIPSQYEFSLLDIAGVLTATDFGALIDTAFDLLDGDFAPYATIGFAKLARRFGTDYLGITTPIENAIKAAFNEAQFFSNANCNEFPCQTQWCHEWDFQVGVLIGGFVEQADGYFNAFAGDELGWYGQRDEGSNQDRNYLKCTFESAYIKTIEFEYNGNDGGNIFAYICPQSGGVECSALEEDTNNSIISLEVNQNMDVFSFGMERATPPTFIGYITRLKVTGEGFDPFAEVIDLCP